MPNLGAGVDQSVNPAVTPTWIFTPTPNVTPTVQIVNTGRNPAYIGTSGLDQPGGFQLLPGSHPLRLQNVQATLYAISGVSVGAASGTMSASAVAAGSTAITLTTAVPASLAAGTTIVVGSTANTGWEAQVVATTTATSQLTFANALVNDHVNGSVVYVATANPAQLRVTAGAV
jgi:hypothetical protein